jgi:hypothetical protein
MDHRLLKEAVFVRWGDEPLGFLATIFMKKLSEVPFDEIYIGMEVVSAIGTKGYVYHLRKLDAPRHEDNEIDIKWDNDNESIGVWHFWCDKISVLS